MRRPRSSYGIFPRRKTRIRHAVLEFKATATSTLTPKFVFGPDCRITATVNNGVPMEIASNDDNVSISVTQGDTIRYIITKPESVTEINFGGDNVAGNADILSEFLSLKYLWTYTSGIAFKVDTVWNSTNLQYANLTSSATFGDVSNCEITEYSQLLYVIDTNCVYGIGGGLASAADNLRFQICDCNLPTDDINRIVDDLYASGATGMTINIGGNNAAPSYAQITKINDMINNRNCTITYTQPT